MMQVVSLTSIPPRFAGLGPVLESLLAQRADAVVLWLPRRYARFAGDARPPPLPDGVTLRLVTQDDGPATKLLPALRAFPEARITACDDDVIYGPGWLRALTEGASDGEAVTGAGWSVARLKRQGAAPPFCDIAQGFSGLSVTAGMFDAEVFDIPEEARLVDDIWLSGHLARRGVAIRQAPKARALCTPLDRPAPLQETREAGMTRAEANAACAALMHARYGLWPSVAAAS